MKNYIKCHICGREVAYEEGGVIPGYCGDDCYDKDMEDQIKEKGYFSSFIPLQVSKVFPIKSNGTL